MNILIVGSMNTVFIHSYKKVFESLGCNTFIANTSPKFKAKNSNGIDLYDYQNDKSKRVEKLRKFAKFIKLDRLNFLWNLYERKEYEQELQCSIENRLESYIQENAIDIVFCFWGTTLKKEVNSLKKIQSNASRSFKLVLCLNTYPVRLELPKEFDEQKYAQLSKDKAYFSSFDAIICSSNEMKTLLTTHLMFNGATYTSLDFLHSSLFSKQSTSYVPNSLVFLGNVDFNKRTIDDVTDYLLQLADKGISVWVQESSGLKHSNIHEFKPFTYEQICNGALSDFISRFTASLVIYNNFNNLRTSISYPTRFALATLGRQKIFIPKGTFNSLENYFLQNQIEQVSTFSDITDLIGLIKVEEARRLKNSNTSYGNFFESDFGSRDKELMKFLKGLI